MQQLNDEEVVKEIYDEYVKSVAEKIVELHATLGAEDWVPLDRTAHTLKGNALAAGDEDIATLAIEIRKAAALKDAETCRKLLAKIEEMSKLL